MDIIHILRTHEGPVHYLYREQGKHTFQVGKEYVVKIDVMDTFSPFFPYSPMAFDNITGRFNDFLWLPGLLPLQFEGPGKFQKQQKQMFHIEGTLTLHQNVIHFKGCKSMASIRNIAHDLCLHDDKNSVHMALMTGTIGKMVDVRLGCYIDRYCNETFNGVIYPRSRVIDVHPIIYLESTRWDDTVFPHVPLPLRPQSIVCTVSSKGTIIIRMTWNRVHWGDEIEQYMLNLGKWFQEMIQSCC